MREIFEEEHEMFRDSFRKFVEREITPNNEKWEEEGAVSRELWLKAGENGFLCMDAPEEYGGVGLDDFRYNMIVGEELIRGGTSAPGFTLQNDVVAPYILNQANDEQKKRWMPGMISGETITSIAMTEPNTGSDLQGVRTTAIDQGDHYLVNGQKTFITNGVLSNFCIVVARTNPDPKAGHQGISLIVVETPCEGYAPPKKLDKIGLRGQDTAELFFDNVKVPKENLLGKEGQGFIYLMQNLPKERLTIAVSAIAACEAALDMTLDYVKERTAFGRPIGKFQNSRFKLAEMKTEIHIGRLFVDHCVMKLNEGKLSPAEASMAKYWTSELQKRVVDECLQLHGGYGYMMEYPIAKMFLDGRVQTIYGGTTEIMKEIIGRSMGL